MWNHIPPRDSKPCRWVASSYFVQSGRVLRAQWWTASWFIFWGVVFFIPRHFQKSEPFQILNVEVLWDMYVKLCICICIHLIYIYIYICIYQVSRRRVVLVYLQFLFSTIENSPSVAGMMLLIAYVWLHSTKTWGLAYKRLVSIATWNNSQPTTTRRKKRPLLNTFNILLFFY